MASKVAPMQRSGIRGGRYHGHSRIPLHSIQATLAIVQPADDVAGLIEQPGLAPSRGRILMPVHPCFLTLGLAPLCYNPLHRQGLVSLADAPPGYNTARRRLNPLRSRSLSRGKTGTTPVLST